MFFLQNYSVRRKRLRQRVSFSNSEKERLVGDLELPSESKPEWIIVICHGFLGTRQGGGRAVVLGERLAGAGYGVLRFDFAGSGDSEGDFSSATLTKNVGDLCSALDFLESQGFRKFLVFGRSFGGNAALAGAVRDPRLHGVCLWSTPVEMLPILHRIVGEDLYQALLRGERVSWSDGLRTFSKKGDFIRDLQKYQMRVLVAEIAPRPLLIVHGEADELVPVSEAEELFQAAGEPSELFLIPGGDHHLSQHQEQATRATLTWLRRFF
ncbi:MAG: alpha/beta fold hydrolase [Bacillota bacterium]|nr:alpha/beta fold hydrolase [Bacillota bacterium]